MKFEQKKRTKKDTKMTIWIKQKLIYLKNIDFSESKWLAIFSITALLIIYWITKDIAITAMLLLSIVIYLGWILSPRIIMFMVYQLIVSTLVWYFLDQYWLPLISNAWDWLNNSLKAVTCTALVGLSVYSIFSCWDDETLGATDLGHWSISEWLPKEKWASNLKNGPLGVFTGLPAWLVSIKKIPGIVTPVKKTFVIQVEIDGDPLNRKFAAVFDTSFNEQVKDTLKTLLVPSKLSDLEKIFEKSLTDWLNANKYTDVKGLKADIVNIQKNVLKSLDDAEVIYGKKMSDPRVIDIQLPEDIITQQIVEAKEITDLEGFIEQSKKLWLQFPKMSDKDIADLILTLRGINKKTTFNTTGGSGGNKKNSKAAATPVVII